MGEEILDIHDPTDDEVFMRTLETFRALVTVRKDETGLEAWRALDEAQDRDWYEHTLERIRVAVRWIRTEDKLSPRNQITARVVVDTLTVRELKRFFTLGHWSELEGTNTVAMLRALFTAIGGDLEITGCGEFGFAALDLTLEAYDEELDSADWDALSGVAELMYVREKRFIGYARGHVYALIAGYGLPELEAPATVPPRK